MDVLTRAFPLSRIKHVGARCGARWIVNGALIAAAPAACRADSPFASTVVTYLAGSGAAPGFTNPLSALGSPERFTGEGFQPQCVTPFQPAFRPNEIVSIGTGGSLVLAFDHDVVDDPRNPFGVDLIVFGNSFFTDLSGGSGVVGGLAADGGRVLVSADGLTWIEVPNAVGDGLFPTLGYLDVTPFSTFPGVVESDFLRPVDPTMSIGDIVGLDYATLLDRYDGSGGGTGIDLALVGLSSIRFVRIDGPSAAGFSPEIDAVADVAPSVPTADIDDSGSVDAADLSLLLTAWGAADPAIDFDFDGSVGAGDLSILLGAWGKGGTP